MTKYIPYARQSIDGADIRAVVKVLKSDYITQGPRVYEFEKKIAKYCGAKYAVALNSGTSALHAACFAAGIKDLKKAAHVDVEYIQVCYNETK